MKSPDSKPRRPRKTSPSANAPTQEETADFLAGRKPSTPQTSSEQPSAAETAPTVIGSSEELAADSAPDSVTRASAVATDTGGVARRPVMLAIAAAGFVLAVATTSVLINVFFFGPPAEPVDPSPELAASAQPEDQSDADAARRDPIATPENQSFASKADADVFDQPSDAAAPIVGSLDVDANPDVLPAEDVPPPVETPLPSISNDAAVAAADAAPDSPAEGAETTFRNLLEPMSRTLPEFESAAQRTKWLEHLRDMMAEGFGSGREALDAASSSFEQARSINADDPRLYHGYGLVLWKKIQYDDSLDELKKSVEQAEDGWWPSHQLLIRLLLARRHPDDAVARLEQMAEVMSSIGRSGDDDLRAAAWMGRLVAYLLEPTNTVRIDVALVENTDLAIEQKLKGKLLESYRAGKQRLAEDFLAMNDVTDAAESRIAAEDKKRAEAEQVKINRDRGKALDREEQLQQVAEQSKEAFDTQMKRNEEKLKRLYQEFQQYAASGRRLAYSITSLNSDIVDIEIALGRARTSLAEIPASSRDSNERSRRKAAEAEVNRLFGLFNTRVSMRNELQSQYNLLDRRAAGVRRTGVAIVQQSAAATQQYQQQTGLIVAESDTLRKWDKTLKERAQDAAKPGGKAKLKTRAARKTARALNTYLRFDPVVERERLLATLPVE